MLKAFFFLLMYIWCTVSREKAQQNMSKYSKLIVR